MMWALKIVPDDERQGASHLNNLHAATSETVHV